MQFLHPMYVALYLELVDLISTGTSIILKATLISILPTFHTRRRLATVLQEIQQYQNTPYCIEPEPSIQKFLISQDPQGDATPLQWEESLFQQSHIIEPKDQPPIRVVCTSSVCQGWCFIGVVHYTRKLITRK